MKHRLAQLPTYILAALVLAMIGILIVPLPPPILDALLAIDLLFAGMVLAMSIVIHEPIEFAAFAPALLVATLFRLALDVSATRLILTQGDQPDGVGTLIPAFGAFVVGGNLVVGMIVFAILVTIQFVVIASGAGRVAEVAARFTLDALPGKQMAIDAELHAGAIDLATAKMRRAAVQREADFFGAMDGAGKFVKGDAIAALVIVVLNIIGGLIIGIMMRGMDPLTALQTFAMLSIGNALLTTLPAFLLSIAMGLLVTRVASDGSLGVDLVAQILGRPDVLRIGGVFAFVLACVPALPHALFLVLSSLAFAVAQWALHERSRNVQTAEYSRNLARRAASRRPEAALARIGVDAVTLMLGSELAALSRGPSGEALLERIADVRRTLASELGVIMPGVRLREDMRMPIDGYAIFIRDEHVAQGRLQCDTFLGVADEPLLALFGDTLVREPVYGLPAVRLEMSRRDEAVQRGMLVFDPISIIGSHLAEVVRSHANRLVGRHELQTLLDHLRGTAPELVKELQHERVGVSLLLRVLQKLLSERIWPRDPITTFEAVLDAVSRGCDEQAVVEAVRTRVVPAQLRRAHIRLLKPLIFDPAFEGQLLRSLRKLTDGGIADPRLLVSLREEVLQYMHTVPRAQAAVVCMSGLRADVSDFLARIHCHLAVYAYNEIPHDIVLEPSHVVGREMQEPTHAETSVASVKR